MSWKVWRARAAVVGVPLGVFLVSFGVYLRTMAPTVYNLDSAELATGAYTLGIVHPPGYPTYLLLGKLFTLLPVGDVGYRLNLMSGFFGALTVAVVALVGRRLGFSITAAVAASLLLAFSYYYWTSSVVAEVYTLHALFLALFMLLLLAWSDRRDRRTLLALALLYGLSFGSHTSSALLAPGLVAFLLLHRDRRDAIVPAAIGMGCSFAVGLLVFAYLPMRYASGALNLTGRFDASGHYHTTDLTTLEGLRWFVGGEQFRWLMLAYDLPGFLGEGTRYALWLWGTFAGIGIVLGALGIVEWLRTRPKDLVATGLLFAGPLLFFVDYAAVDKETMFLPTYVIWSLWIGAGADALLQQLVAVARTWSPRWRHASRLAHAPLLLMPVFVLAVNFGYADVSWDRRSREWASEILQTVEPNAIVLGWWTDVQPMVYLQHVETVRPDVTVLSRLAIAPTDLERLLDQRVGTTPVYSATFDPQLSTRYTFEPIGRAFRLRPRAAAAPTVVSAAERGSVQVRDLSEREPGGVSQQEPHAKTPGRKGRAESRPTAHFASLSLGASTGPATRSGVGPAESQARVLDVHEVRMSARERAHEE